MLQILLLAIFAFILGLVFLIKGSDIFVDGARIERMTANLLRNALEHTPAGGRIEVKVIADDDWVSLRVRDTGEGIEEADLPYIWDRFFRADKSRGRGPTAADGAGLGLAIVKHIIDRHDGFVLLRDAQVFGAHDVPVEISQHHGEWSGNYF